MLNTYKEHYEKYSFGYPELSPELIGKVLSENDSLLNYIKMNEDYKINLSKKAERNRMKIQSKIEYCTYCQPYDGGDVIWVFGDKYELDELFIKCDIPEEQWDNIMGYLECPNCGHYSFELSLDVGIKSKHEIALDRYIDQTLKKYGPIIKEFDDLLEKTPLLAFSHKFGRKLFNDLKKSQLPITEVKGRYFRARESKSSEVLSKEKMMNPPIGKPHEGRYNHSGQSHLYISNDWKTSIEEVIVGDEDRIVWTLELMVEKVDKILDLSFNWMLTTPETSPIYFALCAPNFVNRFDRNNELWKPDYFLTRYIMDCVKMLGYNGIKYNSSKASYIENVVLFYPEKCVIEANDLPQLHLYRKKEMLKKELIDL